MRRIKTMQALFDRENECCLEGDPFNQLPCPAPPGGRKCECYHTQYRRKPSNVSA